MGPIKDFLSVLALSTLVNAAPFVHPVNPIMERPLPTFYADSVPETTAVAVVPGKRGEPNLIKEIVGNTVADIPFAIRPTSSALEEISTDPGLWKKTAEAISDSTTLSTSTSPVKATATPKPPSGEKAASLDTAFWKKAIAVDPKFWKKSVAPSTTATFIDTSSPTPKPAASRTEDTAFW